MEILARVETRDDIEMLRGDEGDAARIYFGVFSAMVRPQIRLAFGIAERSRRPPRDPMNAVLSFLYTLVRAECTSALEGVGLDPQIGFMHALRPGRPALSLDLMEELRPVLADRLALLICQREAVHVAFLVGDKGGAVGGGIERVAHGVEREALLRRVAVEHRRVGNDAVRRGGFRAGHEHAGLHELGRG